MPAYIHSDHLSSTSLVTPNPEGALLQRIAEINGWAYPAIQNPKPQIQNRHTGQRREDSLGGLYDYRARMYDPLVGSFLSPDSIVPQPGQPVDWNRFAYVRGNPVRYSDPSGHCPPSVCRNPDGTPADDYYRYGDRNYLNSLSLGGPNPWFVPQPIDNATVSRYTPFEQIAFAVTPQTWHDELIAFHQWNERWGPFIEFGLSIATMTGSGVPSRPPVGYRQPPPIVVHYTTRGNYQAIRNSGFVLKPSPAEGLFVEPAPPGIYFGDINPPFPGFEPPYSSIPIKARWGIHANKPEYFIAVSPSSLPKGRAWYARLWPHNEGRPEWILVTSEPIDISSGVIGHGHVDLLNKWWLRNR